MWNLGAFGSNLAHLPELAPSAHKICTFLWSLVFSCKYYILQSVPSTHAEGISHLKTAWVMLDRLLSAQINRVTFCRLHLGSCFVLKRFLLRFWKFMKDQIWLLIPLGYSLGISNRKSSLRSALCFLKETVINCFDFSAMHPLSADQSLRWNIFTWHVTKLLTSICCFSMS